MPLKLTITSYQRLSPGQETTKILDRGSISIGRAAQCDWILQDPERILSGKHCTVHHQDGGYFLTDNSTNGVYLNDSEQRIGRSEIVRLHDGDRFVLGEYEIAVTLLATAAELDEIPQEGPITDVALPVRIPQSAVSTLPAAGVVSLGSEGAPPGLAKPSFSDLLSEDAEDAGESLDISPSSRSPAVGAVATEPSADLMSPDRAFFEPPALIAEASPSSLQPPPVPSSVVPTTAGSAESAPAFDPFADRAETVNMTVAAETAPIAAEPVIPEDWWMAPAAPAAPPALDQSPKSPPPPPPVAAKPSTPSPPPPPVQPPAKAAVAAEPVGPDAKALIHAFLEGAGLPHARLSDDQLPEIMKNLGAIFRETTQGLMEILLARGDIKGEFRLDRTNIGPIENNPLKTPPGQPPLTPEEVMTLLLIRRQGAYMSPVQAVREGFNDIKAHQLSVMAGIQSALNRLLQRFDPSNLETRLQQTVLDSILAANRKAKYWDLFTAEYRTIAHEAEEDFNELFGDEFARAYEERSRTR
ncbi:MAG: type VI secretion system-associated FHA domain protein TagH [Synechococcaceae cyanobacterium SM1_2_3]|nr:type VI secretion system-associated FHA domain protein TagH [Synechococcaceae cyanobacterium SM1_2_3]